MSLATQPPARTGSGWWPATSDFTSVALARSCRWLRPSARDWSASSVRNALGYGTVPGFCGSCGRQRSPVHPVCRPLACLADCRPPGQPQPMPATQISMSGSDTYASQVTPQRDPARPGRCSSSSLISLRLTAGRSILACTMLVPCRSWNAKTMQPRWAGDGGGMEPSSASCCLASGRLPAHCPVGRERHRQLWAGHREHTADGCPTHHERHKAAPSGTVDSSGVRTFTALLSQQAGEAEGTCLGRCRDGWQAALTKPGYVRAAS